MNARHAAAAAVVGVLAAIGTGTPAADGAAVAAGGNFHATARLDTSQVIQVRASMFDRLAAIADDVTGVGADPWMSCIDETDQWVCVELTAEPLTGRPVYVGPSSLIPTAMETLR